MAKETHEAVKYLGKTFWSVLVVLLFVFDLVVQALIHFTSKIGLFKITLNKNAFQ